jgi:hypothetical protein
MAPKEFRVEPVAAVDAATNVADCHDARPRFLNSAGGGLAHVAEALDRHPGVCQVQSDVLRRFFDAVRHSMARGFAAAR